MRILLVSQWFTPEPFFKGLPFARALMDRGHDVQVLTGFPNYPGGRLYPGYRLRPLQREVMEGIPVIRVPLYPSHDASSVRRAVNYASFALSAACIGPWAAKKADVAYVYHPPATVALPAMALHWMRRVPFVYDVQDLWPDTLGATGMLRHRAILNLVGRWCSLAYRKAARIVVLSPGFRDALVRRGVPGSKIEVIYNWCEEDCIRRAPRNEALADALGMAGRFNIVFAGTMGKAQALDAVLECAGIVAKRSPKLQFVFVGGGIDVDRLKAIARGKCLSNVLFLARRPVSEIGDLLNLADVLLVHLKDDPLFRITIPSKIQTYLAVGRPILAGVGGDAAALVEKAGAGISCIPERAESIAGAAESMFRMAKGELQAMGENGRRYYWRELSRDAGVTRFEEIFQAVTGKK
jgi:glycosyltransferase involved in cell wall biosynthesis